MSSTANSRNFEHDVQTAKYSKMAFIQKESLNCIEFQFEIYYIRYFCSHCKGVGIHLGTLTNTKRNETHFPMNH